MENNFGLIKSCLEENLVWNNANENYDTKPWDFIQALDLIKENAKNGIYTPLEKYWQEVYKMADHDLTDDTAFVDEEYFHIEAAKKIISFYYQNFNLNFDFIQGVLNNRNSSRFDEKYIVSARNIYFNGIAELLRNNQFNKSKSVKEDFFKVFYSDFYALLIPGYILPRHVFYSAIKITCPNSLYSKSITQLKKTYSVKGEDQVRSKRKVIPEADLESLNLKAKEPIVENYEFSHFEKDFDYVIDYYNSKYNILIDENILTLLACEYASPFGDKSRTMNKLFYPEKDFNLMEWYKKHNNFKLPTKGQEIYTSLEKYLNYFH